MELRGQLPHHHVPGDAREKRRRFKRPESERSELKNKKTIMTFLLNLQPINHPVVIN